MTTPRTAARSAGLTTHRRPRPDGRRLASLVLAGGLLVGCSSTATNSTPTTSAPSSSEPTTAPPSTAAPTTTQVTVPSGWTVLDLAEASSFASPPCCGANWYGQPSPAFPDDGAPLADGAYRTVGTWPRDLSSGVLELELMRFDTCAALGADGCADPSDPAVDALGVDASSAMPVLLALDDQLRVVVWGYLGLGDEQYLRAASVGNGADLLALARNVDAAFESVFLTPVREGSLPDDVIADVRDTSVGGFAAAPDDGGLVVYLDDRAAGDVPQILYQIVYGTQDPLESRGTDPMLLVSLVVERGVPTLYVYAGFLS